MVKIVDSSNCQTCNLILDFDEDSEREVCKACHKEYCKDYYKRQEHVRKMREFFDHPLTCGKCKYKYSEQERYNSAFLPVYKGHKCLLGNNICKKKKMRKRVRGVRKQKTNT